MASPPAISVLVLDAGPLISNTSLPKAETYYSTPAVIAELKDESARHRVQSLYALEVRAPKRTSIDFVRSFAKKTGDLQVLSATDIHVIALTYELECELNGGDWRLRNTPGQERINGRPPVKDAANQDTSAPHDAEVDSSMLTSEATASSTAEKDLPANLTSTQEPPEELSTPLESLRLNDETLKEDQGESPKEEKEEFPIEEEETSLKEDQDELPKEEEEEEEADDDDDDWITPSNIKQHQANDSNMDATAHTIKPMKVACATHDFALQNVLLQIGLNLVSGTGQRITSVKTWVLRCHACFKISRQSGLKFCPSCGGATLMRTSVSVDSRGVQKVHLKRNMQWNNRGTVYSIPKQQHGTANMKGRDNLILRADQREVEKIAKREKYKKEIDLLDPDYIPAIVSGRRPGDSSYLKVGHGRRNVNSNKKR